MTTSVVSLVLLAACALLGAALYVMNRWRVLGLVFVAAVWLLTWVPGRWSKRTVRRLCNWYTGVLESTPTTDEEPLP